MGTGLLTICKEDYIEVALWVPQAVEQAAGRDRLWNAPWPRGNFAFAVYLTSDDERLQGNIRRSVPVCECRQAADRLTEGGARTSTVAGSIRLKYRFMDVGARLQVSRPRRDGRIHLRRGENPHNAAKGETESYAAPRTISGARLFHVRPAVS